MSFQAPLFLAGLVLVPLALALYVRRERRGDGTDAFAPARLLPSVLPNRPGWRRHVPAAVYGAALAALVVALARPEATIAVPVEQATVMVVTDRSGSMLAKDVRPDRLTAARDAAATFLDAVPGDLQVGAIAFNHTVSVLQQPTEDHGAVRRALGGVRAAGSTATGDALSAALRTIRASRGPQGADAPAAVILLSDGKSVRGQDPLVAADAAREAGIPVYTVALGTADGTIETRSGTEPVPPDPATLEQIAERSGGEAFTAADAAGLKAVYERLGSEVATEDRRQEVTGMVAGGALLLLAAAAMASLRWFGRVI